MNESLQKLIREARAVSTWLFEKAEDHRWQAKVASEVASNLERTANDAKKLDEDDHK